MKKLLLLLSVLTALLLSLTGCNSRNQTTPTYPNADYNGYDDSEYTADEDGMTNERGQDGTNVRPNSGTSGNSSANNSATNNRVTNNNGNPPDNNNSSSVNRPSGSMAQGVQDAVDEAGNVVDDIANGAANAVDDATDAVENAAGAVTGKNAVTHPNSAA